MNIEELKVTLQQTTSEIKSAVEKRDAEIKKFGEVTEETRKQLTAATNRLDEIKTDLDRKAEDQKKMDERLIELEKKAARNFGGDVDEYKSIGSRFVESDVYKSMSGSNRANGLPVRVEKAISGLANSAGALVRPDRRPDVIVAPDRPRYIRDLLVHLPTSSNAVEVMRQNVFTNNAGPQQPSVANSAIGAGEWQGKNESNVTYELVTVPIRTMAHWLPASRQILSDAPQLQRLIDSRLMYGLNLNSDAQLLYGDGTNQNLTGLMVDDGISDIGDMTVAVDESIPAAMLDHIRHAVTQCQTYDFYNINGLVLNPQDWELLETAKGSDGHYIWVTVPNGGEPRLWRVPVVVTNAIQSGEFLLGDWTIGATVYDREQMDIRVSESHADYFVKNGIVVLAEERIGFGIELPKAFTKGSFAVAS